MKENNDFFKRLQDIAIPKVEEGIKNKNPYEICNLLEETKGGPNMMYLQALEDSIMTTKDIVHIYEFMFLAVDMNIKGFDMKRFERAIIKSKNPKLMCYCMGFVPGTDIHAMLNALLKTKNAKYMEMILKDGEYSEVLEAVKQIDPEYERKVEDAKDFDYYPESLNQFIDLRDNIYILMVKVLETRNPHLITELANYIEYLNEYKGQNINIRPLVVAEEEIKDPMQVYEFLASVNVEDKTNLIQAAIDSGMVKFMYYIYEYVPDLTEDEKNKLKENIIEKDKDGKYKQKVEGVLEEEVKGEKIIE